ncbi:MAG: hypothetical protein ABL874_05690 [Sphingopyxis sp.]
MTTLRLFIRATLLCGTLDIFYAIANTVRKGGSALGVLHSVASGPFGNGMRDMGWTGGGLGLGVHFGIMAVMVATFLFAWRRMSALRSINPWVVGTLYGAALYGVMYCVVLAWRWPALFPQSDPAQIAIALFPHIALVGIPLALMARRANTGLNQP